MAQKRKQPEPIASRLASPGSTPSHGKKGLLTWKWAEERLIKRRNFCIATVRKDGSPHVMIIWGLWFNRVMYFSTGPRSQKALNLEQNPNCVICADQDGEAVVIEAVARKLSASELDRNLLSLYQRKYRWDPRSLGNAIYAAHPSVVFGMDEKRGPRSSTRWVFRRD
ncbi:MAG: pyridoxamine 5'-phosphate oxidase family protein [Acidobacteriota bacterium]|nr:pyridoxamine 5'-phosphate oxidase family protein [Acidobacteriota bacterium]